jgi:hypothetical protein
MRPGTVEGRVDRSDPGGQSPPRVDRIQLSGSFVLFYAEDAKFWVPLAAFKEWVERADWQDPHPSGWPDPAGHSAVPRSGGGRSPHG